MDKLQKHLGKLRNLLEITFFRVLLYLILGFVLFTAMYSNVKPEKLDLRKLEVAEQTVRSPITVEDKDSTERKRKEALEEVNDVYSLNREIAQNRIDLTTSIFQSAIEVIDETKETYEKADVTESPILSIQERVEILKRKLTDNETKELTNQTFIALVQAKKGELTIAKDITITAINEVMSKKISASDVVLAKNQLEEQIKSSSLNSSLKSSAIELGRYAVVQNVFYDQEATETLRQQTIEGIEPVRILQGQIIVEEGKFVDQHIYRQLELVGVLDSKNAIQPFIGLTLVILIVLSAIYYFFYEQRIPTEAKQSNLLLFSIIFILAIVIMKIVSLFQQFDYAEIGYVFPAAMGALLIKILMDEKLSILYTIIIAICGSTIFNQGTAGTFNMAVGIYILCSGIAGILILSRQNHRSKILKAGLLVSLVNIVVILALMFLQNGQYSGLDYGLYILVALVSGISSSVLTIGLLPFFEASFGILSTMRLIELSNPNHPLLRKILTETPGTYHHSVMVANLADAACEAIGANGLLARVGCYYHDIGKTKRPQFFIENQMNIENPHDRLPPQTSANIIVAHATDGAEMLKKHRMPKEIIDIAEQHHGTTLLKFFYHKANKNGKEAKEEDYRYPGPRAQTKEAAIVGIADSVEAAVRSMSQPTAEQIESLIRNIISDRLQDGQLNECDLTLKELDIVAHSFIETLKGIFHSRIEYPKNDKVEGEK
ncbi:HD family phosphohydrolase [Pseudoneobacillus rhizosphaerae]|uniref:Cyclic-di-AMP phosphodiesterase PgpH n=1 Tax=Pseudoneobacillus rhizosphaerae TaxID=2880968 RepID=A0A9C7LAQ7_9BACI|nr:HD family phosphohydrolase [Pseudoneobacillus rhizosphaerae]CAG9608118.1 Cyclic-di-AMP phosphodiesterase PgpH [Pseudoneobacillus rhizosphaerae]